MASSLPRRENPRVPAWPAGSRVRLGNPGRGCRCGEQAGAPGEVALGAAGGCTRGKWCAPLGSVGYLRVTRARVQAPLGGITSQGAPATREQRKREQGNCPAGQGLVATNPYGLSGISAFPYLLGGHPRRGMIRR